MTIKRMILISTFAALLVLSALSPVQIEGVAFTLQTMAIMLIGLLMRPRDSFLTVLVYLFIGLVGLPVFSNAQAGFHVFVGPTGGFLVAFPFASFLISLFKSKDKNILKDILVLFLFGFLFIYLVGIPYYSFITTIPIDHAITLTFIPFYLVDIVKIVIAYMIYYLIPDDLKSHFKD
ncbi:MAG TPA: biotin transporter BioY [Acholeplasma sp.]|nr:biotin transporter BioY [Acholeplasma sp.]